MQLRLYQYRPGNNVIETTLRDGATFESNSVYPETHVRHHFTEAEVDRLFAQVSNLPSDAILLKVPKAFPDAAMQSLRDKSYSEAPDIATLRSLVSYYELFARKRPN